LSSALSKYPNSFDTLYVSLVAAGEAVGSLGPILSKISLLLEKQSKLKRELGNALIYPSVLAVFSLIVIGALLGFVVPSIEDMFQDKELNGFTKSILFLSHFINEKWWIYIPTLVFGGAFAYMKLKSQRGKEWLENKLMKTPLIKKIVVGAALARFCRTMGTLQEGGLQMVESLKLAEKVMQNRTLELVIRKAKARIVEGSQLTVELKRSSWIPPLMVRLLSIGEETGSVGSMFNKLADIYEGDLEKLLSRTVALAQPVILILMGGFIGLVMVATLLPLTQMASLR
jgi:general secretion pathway protein F/type IV pilus assembly protein PilC